jgi:hypothetical protein
MFELLKVVDMDIKSWFSSQGSYADGLKLYSQLPSCNATILKSLLGRILHFETEIRAQEGFFIIDRHKCLSQSVSTEPKKSIKPTNLLKEIIKQSAAVSFEKKQWRCTLWNCTLPTVRG